MSRNAFNPFTPVYRQRFPGPITVLVFYGPYLAFGAPDVPDVNSNT